MKHRHPARPEACGQRSAAASRPPRQPNLLNIAAACLFDAGGRLLLVRKRATRALMLPGGKAEPGEDGLTALKRELREELNLQLPDGALSRLGRFRAVAANEADTWVDAEIFLARLHVSVSAAAELEELYWLAPHVPAPSNLAPLLREQVLPALGWSHRQPPTGRPDLETPGGPTEPTAY